MTFVSWCWLGLVLIVAFSLLTLFACALTSANKFGDEERVSPGPVSHSTWPGVGRGPGRAA